MGVEGEAQVPYLRMNGCLGSPLGAGGETERLLGHPFRGRG